MKPYEFSVIRYQHAATTGEVINIGIILWSPEERRLSWRINERYGRLSRAYPGFDGAAYRQLVRTLVHQLERRAERLAGELFDARVPFETHLHAIIPIDAGCLQTSEIMGGIHPDPAERAAQLYAQFVTRFDLPTANARRDDEDIWTRIEESLARHGLTARVRRNVVVASDDFKWEFRCGWTNGVPQVLEPVSFDYIANAQVLDLANTWAGRLLSLQRGAEFKFTAVVAPPSRGASLEAFEKAIRNLSRAPCVRRVVLEDDFEMFLPELEHDLEHH